MNKFAECFCGQLSIEVTAEPEFHDSNHQYGIERVRNNHSDNFSYFKNDHVIGTTGKAICHKVEAQEEGISKNRYHCVLCDTALFCVDSDKLSLVGIVKEQLITETSANESPGSSLGSAAVTTPDADYAPKFMAPSKD